MYNPSPVTARARKVGEYMSACEFGCEQTERADQLPQRAESSTNLCVCMCVCAHTDHLLAGSLWICFHVGPEPLQHRKICVWAHFLFTRAQCNICKTISNSGRTTNMLIHLLATHAIKMQECCVFWCLAGNRWIPSG